MNRSNVEQAQTGRARSSDRDDRLVVLTNIPAPYRTSFFNTLNETLAAEGLGLHVLYCAEREPNRHWPFDPDEHRYPFTILPGLHFTLRGAYIHVNPTVIGTLRRLDPRWLLVGGAWHLPTVLLSGLPGLCPSTPRILWTEGHSDAVLNPHGPIAAVRRRHYSCYDAFAVPNARSGQYATTQANVERPLLPLANTVDEDFYRQPPDLDKRTLRSKLGVPHDARVLVTVCQLVDRKGVVELARSFATIPLDESAHPKFELVFIGDGERRRQIEDVARSISTRKIRVVGHVPPNEVRDWLWAADAFALATRMDPNPLSPIEASFAQLPLLLSSRAGNVDELLLPNRTGWRFDPFDAVSMCEALTAFVRTGANALQEMGVAALRNADESFRRNVVASRFVASLLREFPMGPARSSSARWHSIHPS